MSPMVRLGGLVGVALVAAVFLALMTRNMAASHAAPRPVAAAAPKVEARVLVAARDLTAGERLSTSDFAWQPWPAENLNPAYIVDRPSLPGAPITNAPPGAVRIETAAVNAAASKAHELLVASGGGPAARLVDAIVREPMIKGEPILEAKVVRAGSGGVMAVTLTPGMRAMSIPLSAETAAGGFILPGDHVDVVQSRQTALGAAGEKHFTAVTVLRNVKVMAIDQNASRAGLHAAQVGATATLEVSPEQAELVAMSKAQGDLTIVLRSYADIAGATTAGIQKDAPQDASDVVKVFRDGKTSDVQVAR